VDEIAPLIALAGRAIAGEVAGKVVGKGLGLESDKDKKKKELAAQKKSAEVQEEGKAAVIKKALTKVAKNPKVRAAVLRVGSQVATSMADKEEEKKIKESRYGKIMNKYVKALMEKAGRDLSPVQKRYENIPASDVAAAKPGRGGVDPQVQKDVGDEAKRTQAKVPGSDPDAAHLLAQKKARDAAAKAKGEKPTGDTRGHGTPNPIQPSRT
jgi:hypothetical protein